MCGAPEGYNITPIIMLGRSALNEQRYSEAAAIFLIMA